MHSPQVKHSVNPFWHWTRSQPPGTSITSLGRVWAVASPGSFLGLPHRLPDSSSLVDELESEGIRSGSPRLQEYQKSAHLGIVPFKSQRILDSLKSHPSVGPPRAGSMYYCMWGGELVMQLRQQSDWSPCMTSWVPSSAQTKPKHGSVLHCSSITQQLEAV